MGVTRFDLLIPYKDLGDSYRNRIFQWNLTRLRGSFPSTNIIVSSDNNDSTNEFSRSRARNLAAKASVAEVLCFVDADTVFNPEAVWQGLDWVHENGSHVLPYDYYYRLDKTSTDSLLASSPLTRLDTEELTYDYILSDPPVQYEEPISGLLMMHRDVFWKIGGFSEEFVGWGYEDRAFIRAADCIMHGRIRLQGNVFHLWHPEPMTTTWHNPHIEHNKNLYNKINAVHQDEEMKQAYGQWV